MPVKPDVTFSAAEWVWLDLRGEDRGPGRIRDDGGVAHELLVWMIREEIPFRAQASGGGQFSGRIPVEDWEKVRAWLQGKKARRVRER